MEECCSGPKHRFHRMIFHPSSVRHPVQIPLLPALQRVSLLAACFLSVSRRRGVDMDATFTLSFFFFGRLVEKTCLRTDAGMKGTILTICARLMWRMFHSAVGEEASRPTDSRTLVGFSCRKKHWCQPEPRESPVTPGSPPPLDRQKLSA